MSQNSTKEESIVLGVIELASQILKRSSNITRRAGLTTQQWLILLYIKNDPNIPLSRERNLHHGVLASDIADALNVSRPNVTNLIHSLVEKDLITQTRDEDDKRRKRLELTDKAKALLAKIEPLRRDSNRILFEEMTDSDKQKLLNLLTQCFERIYWADSGRITI
ncbi:MarR family winged helix-turn-helix transcriptional regulator [Hugenholtzia roseola]|uniref:MarR family winged helix-turn-helix transcriptional regulator n=1 Tax=Hugenholtzia roseola TaxID=1002 RepID=UPI00047D799D|nr:MarR family transcriptional regulator [Hugenholtzia roseola]